MRIAPTLPLLIPGVGAQGGDATATVRAGLRNDGPIIVNSSRAILYASKAGLCCGCACRKPRAPGAFWKLPGAEFPTTPTLARSPRCWRDPAPSDCHRLTAAPPGADDDAVEMAGRLHRAGAGANPCRRAAACHPPAFGRRIPRAGGLGRHPLVERGGGPSPSPRWPKFSGHRRAQVRNLTQSHSEELQKPGRTPGPHHDPGHGPHLGAHRGGRLQLVRLQPDFARRRAVYSHPGLADTVGMLERNEADFSLVYHHPAGGHPARCAPVHAPDGGLRPAGACVAPTAQGQALQFGPDATRVPYLAYAPQLALGRLVEDHLAHPHAPRLQRVVECDSADAHYEYVQKGLGVAWLPWSMVFADCKASGCTGGTPAWRCGLTCACTGPSAAWGRWPNAVEGPGAALIRLRPLWLACGFPVPRILNQHDMVPFWHQRPAADFSQSSPYPTRTIHPRLCQGVPP